MKSPEKEGPPSTAYLQIGPDRPDLGRSFQHTGVIGMAAFGRVVDRLVEYSAGTALHVEGRVTGLLRKIPKPGAERMLTPFEAPKPAAERQDTTPQSSAESERQSATAADQAQS